MKLVRIYYLTLLINCISGHIERIAGGQIARQGQFPYFAQIYIVLSDGKATRCGGTLIYPRWILTAGHCFPTTSQSSIEVYALLDWLIVLMGTNKEMGRDGTSNYISKVIFHPEFVIDFIDKEEMQVGRLENDVALAQLRYPYTLNTYIQTIQLPPFRIGNESARCLKGTIVGTGITSFSGASSDWLLYAKVQSMSVERVVSPLPKFINSRVFLRSTVFYTETEWYRGHALEGDSGGPYVCDDGGSAVQYGICSFGFNSSFRNRTMVVVYESVDQHLDFILAYANTTNWKNCRSTRALIIISLWTIFNLNSIL